ncbi:MULTISPECIES: MFS transporter [unclassified Streptomyces]|uniref:MFS transporter n=1 Tax=unclassified Streptomyces TaxID=2593676 RepID=UPI0016604BA4|nr:MULTISPECIES: MFS transporter [unclassified Streptomyces]MBD0708882.1 MFS transporter [Streptomyces sp. CBMA291]MBD0715981.1 MFS transporter [Streptomyces sp. CBMA370]
MPLLPASGPQRTLAVSNFVYTTGSGLYMTAGVLYFTEAVHLPAAQVGLGLAFAGGLALAVGIGVGHLADRHGARGVFAVTLVVQALATAGFLLADDFRLFALSVGAAMGAKAAGLAARSPLIRHYGGERPQEFRAYLRAVTNVGVSLGALLAGWVVQVGTLPAYRLLVVGNALAFAASAAVLVRLPPVKPVPVAGGPRWIALRDGPYLLLTALDGVMAVQFKVLTVAVPLWLVTATTAPRWLISGIMLVNTVLIVAFQVRASKGVDSPVAGGSAYRKAGVAFLGSCALISLAAGAPAWAATALFLGAVVVHTVGELWHSAAGFEVSFALAPPHATGQYLGVFGLGAGLSEALGPALLIGLCITWGRPGWYVTGALFALAGAVAPLAVRWAGRREEGAEELRVGVA